MKREEEEEKAQRTAHEKRLHKEELIHLIMSSKIVKQEVEEESTAIAARMVPLGCSSYSFYFILVAKAYFSISICGSFL